MGTGIMICGLNGTGKSTLGKALAEKLHFYFIDNENLYFSGTELSCVCSGLKIVLFRNSAAECCQAEIYMGRRNGFLILLNPDQRIRLKNGCRA